MFYLRCQLVFYIFLDVCEYIVTIWSNSCLAFQTWGNINNLLWVAGIKLLLQCSSYGLIELFLPTRERKLLFTSSVGWRSSSDGPSDVLISSWRCFILTGKTLNVCSPFRLLFCTASKNPLFGLIKRKHYERKKNQMLKYQGRTMMKLTANTVEYNRYYCVSLLSTPKIWVQLKLHRDQKHHFHNNTTHFQVR